MGYHKGLLMRYQGMGYQGFDRTYILSLGMILFLETTVASA